MTWEKLVLVGMLLMTVMIKISLLVKILSLVKKMLILAIKLSLLVLKEKESKFLKRLLNQRKQKVN